VKAFTIATGLASLFGFILQIFDLFPQLGAFRGSAAMFFLGVCAGSLVRAIAPASIRLNVEMTGFTVLVAVFILAIFGLLVTATLTTDATRRGEMFVAAAFGLAALLVLLMGGFMMMSDRPAQGGLTVRELRMLADDAVEAKDVERAVRHLRAIQSKLQDEQACRKVEEEIQRLERGVAH
jgi:hypothetical protein